MKLILGIIIIIMFAAIFYFLIRAIVKARNARKKIFKDIRSRKRTVNLNPKIENKTNKEENE